MSDVPGKPNTVPLNGRWMFLFKMHLAVVGPLITGLLALAAWNFKTIGGLEKDAIAVRADLAAMRHEFNIIVRDGSPITRERLSVIENHLKIERNPYREKP